MVLEIGYPRSGEYFFQSLRKSARALSVSYKSALVRGARDVDCEVDPTDGDPTDGDPTEGDPTEGDPTGRYPTRFL